MDEDAKELLAEVRAMRAEMRALRAGPQASGKTLRQIYELDLVAWKNETWAASVRATLVHALRVMGDRIADQITRGDWLYYRDEVRAKATTNRKGPPAALTVNLEIQRWRGLYRRQRIEGNCQTNPLEDVKPVRGAKRHRETEPTVVDIEVLRAHCSPLIWAFVKLGFQRGLRASEARRLEWRRVDLAAGTITFLATKDHKTYTLRVTSDVVEALQAIRPELPGRYVFLSPVTGRPMSAVTMWRKFREAADAAGLIAADGDIRVRFHDLRHGFVSRAVRRSGLAVAMRLSRHRGIDAAARYIHVDERDLADDFERMEAEARKPAARTNAQGDTPCQTTKTSRSRTE